MGLGFLLFVELFCGRVAVVNHTKVWRDFDTKQLYYAANKICYERFYPRSPCLKAFIKKEKQVYNVICGGEE